MTALLLLLVFGALLMIVDGVHRRRIRNLEARDKPPVKVVSRALFDDVFDGASGNQYSRMFTAGAGPWWFRDDHEFADQEDTTAQQLSALRHRASEPLVGAAGRRPGAATAMPGIPTCAGGLCTSISAAPFDAKWTPPPTTATGPTMTGAPKTSPVMSATLNAAPRAASTWMPMPTRMPALREGFDDEEQGEYHEDDAESESESEYFKDEPPAAPDRAPSLRRTRRAARQLM